MEEKPEFPSHLNDVARDEWYRMIDLLEAMNMHSDSYRTILELYCETYANYRDALAKVELMGQAIVNKNKKGEIQVRRNPYSVELHKYKDELQKMLVEFGLTPSSKSRVSASPRKKKTVEVRQRG